jgi:hypothetical protein
MAVLTAREKKLAMEDWKKAGNTEPMESEGLGVLLQRAVSDRWTAGDVVAWCSVNAEGES